MRLLDTVVLVGAVNPADPYHRKALEHLDSLASNPEVFLPSTAILEFDLELKAHGYTAVERETTFEDLSVKVPQGKILALSPSAMIEAVKTEAQGLGYFDSLISAQAGIANAHVVTTDREIAKYARTVW